MLLLFVILPLIYATPMTLGDPVNAFQQALLEFINTDISFASEQVKTYNNYVHIKDWPANAYYHARPNHTVVERNYLLLFKPNCSRAQIKITTRLLEIISINVLNQFDSGMNILLNNILSSEDEKQIVDLISIIPWISDIERDTVIKSSQIQFVDAPLWGLDRIDQMNLPLDRKFNFSGTGKGINIYIIDSGLDVTHEEFGGRAKLSYISTLLNDQAETECTSGPSSGHGTHVAGIAAGTNVGVAKLATIHGIKVLNCNGPSQTSVLIDGLNWVAKNAVKPAVLSMSLGPGLDVSASSYSRSPSLDAAIASLIGSGITVIVAAGNRNLDPCSSSPSGTPGVLVVGASNMFDNRASFSNYGPCIGLFAPGTDIYSAKPGGGFQSKQGTSQSTPFVAGAAALLLETNPNMKPGEVADKLMQSATLDVLKDLQGSPNRLLRISNNGANSVVTLAPAGSLNFGSGPTSFWTSKNGFIVIGCGGFLILLFVCLFVYWLKSRKKSPDDSSVRSKIVLVDEIGKSEQLIFRANTISDPILVKNLNSPSSESKDKLNIDTSAKGNPSSNTSATNNIKLLKKKSPSKSRTIKNNKNIDITKVNTPSNIPTSKISKEKSSVLVPSIAKNSESYTMNKNIGASLSKQSNNTRATNTKSDHHRMIPNLAHENNQMQRPPKPNYKKADVLMTNTSNNTGRNNANPGIMSDAAQDNSQIRKPSKFNSNHPKLQVETTTDFIFVSSPIPVSQNNSPLKARKIQSALLTPILPSGSLKSRRGSTPNFAIIDSNSHPPLNSLKLNEKLYQSNLYNDILSSYKSNSALPSPVTPQTPSVTNFSFNESHVKPLSVICEEDKLLLQEIEELLSTSTSLSRSTTLSKNCQKEESNNVNEDPPEYRAENSGTKSITDLNYVSAKEEYKNIENPELQKKENSDLLTIVAFNTELPSPLIKKKD